MMFETFKRRVEAGAKVAARAKASQVARAFREAGQGLMVTEEGDVVTVRARGLIRRWLDDAALRSIGVVR